MWFTRLSVDEGERIYKWGCSSFHHLLVWHGEAEMLNWVGKYFSAHLEGEMQGKDQGEQIWKRRGKKLQADPHSQVL